MDIREDMSTNREIYLTDYRSASTAGSLPVLALTQPTHY
jgi:hypothetical protein